MKLKISDLKTERQWRAATGFDQARFEKLLVLFTASYLNLLMLRDERFSGRLDR
jgi:hypothetical protein